MPILRRVLSLFSGIGAADLGLERAGGFKTVAMCENSPDRQADLARLFPGVKVYDNVLTLSAERLSSDGIFPSVIIGGFPCQDISLAGKGTGIGTADNPTDRSGLWFEYARIIEETQPEWVVIENSPALRSRGLETILGFFDASGYSCWWDGLHGFAFGAINERDRIFIVANRNRDDGRQGRPRRPDTSLAGKRQSIRPLQATDAHGARVAFWEGFSRNVGEELAAIKRSGHLAWVQREAQPGMVGTVYEVAATLDQPRRLSGSDRATWKSRVHGLGNTVFPDIFSAIGRAINLTGA